MIKKIFAKIGGLRRGHLGKFLDPISESPHIQIHTQIKSFWCVTKCITLVFYESERKTVCGDI